MVSANDQQAVTSASLTSPNPSVSVVIPARNAEAVIAATLDSVLSQEYAGLVEVLLADGSDTEATAELVRCAYPTVHVIPNPAQSTSAGLNRAIRKAIGQIIVRCDAHAVLPPGYLQRVVETLERTGAANVGGKQQPIGTSTFERALVIAMTTPLGVGDARYRLGGVEGPTDTVYLGAFRREELEAVGGFDPTLMRNQDAELNWRLRKRGRRVWFDPKLVVLYRPRGNLRTLARQYFDYGRWKRVMLSKHPTSLRPRQLAAPLLVLGLIASVVLAGSGFIQMASALPLVYLSTLVVGSLAVGFHRRAPCTFLLPLILATMHLSWGVGFFCPIWKKGKRPSVVR